MSHLPGQTFRHLGGFLPLRLEPAKAACWCSKVEFEKIESAQFDSMTFAYAATGGIVQGEDIAGFLNGRCSQPISTVARWIVEKKVVQFEWQSHLRLPLFQFDFHTMKIRLGVSQIIEELGPVFDDWGIALWFAQPNALLDGASPADAIGLDWSEVYQAARADRFIARG